MKTRIHFTVLALLTFSILNSRLATVFAQGTAFTYQGRLNDGSGPANGNYDLRFALFDALTSGTQQGNLLTNSATMVSNGLFTVTLDFGGQFPGASRWLEIGVRTNGVATFTTLAPRQNLTPTPYAITASSLSGTLPAAQLSGQLSGAQITNGAVGAVQIDNTAVQTRITGTAPAGQFITGIAANGNITTAPDTTDWKLGGNNVSPGQFLGSTNNQAVEIRVNNSRVLRLEDGGDSNTDPDTFRDGAVNLIGGSPGNSVVSGVVGATIAGGGATNYQSVAGLYYANILAADYATVGGGLGNHIETNAFAATIAGGVLNSISTNSPDTTVGGGYGNTIAANSPYTTIGGGVNNTIGANSLHGVIGGGYGNLIADFSTRATIAGGNFNGIGGSSDSSTIGGGYNNNITDYAAYTTISGGFNNSAATSYATIGGGSNNIINGVLGFIGGGQGNTVAYPFTHDVIGGGLNNTAVGYFAVIGGGRGNQTGEQGAFVGGGENNNASGWGSAVVGGDNNQTTGTVSFIGGGGNNLSGGIYGTVAGGWLNVASGAYSSVPGGSMNTAAGTNSFAAGQKAQALHPGTFVWSDSQAPGFASTTNNQFLIRAGGNVGINTNNPSSTLQVNGQIAATSLRSPGAGINSSTYAFTQRVVSTNASGNRTIIYNPITDNDPNAILIITHNWTADTNTVTKYNTTPVGVYYASPHWAIFNEDNSTMGLGRAFNVLVIKP